MFFLKRWIHAIRDYPRLSKRCEELWIERAQLRTKILALENVISKYENGNPKITKSLPPDMQGIFETHRRAARQSINDAYAAEQEYKKKLA